VRFLEPVLEMRVQAVTLRVFREAVSIRRRFGLSYWDSAILAAARTLGCDAVYSEDMSAEQDYGVIRVINPFSTPGFIPGGRLARYRPTERTRFSGSAVIPSVSGYSRSPG